MVDLNEIILSNRQEFPKRKWVVYCLVDSGFHMHGEKIDVINSALEKLITVDLASCEEALGYYDIRLQVICFGSGAKKIFEKPKAIGDACWNGLNAFGRCDFGSAICLLENELKTDYQDCRNIPPIIIAFSGNQCTDEYKQYISHISQNPWFKRSVKVGVRVGDVADSAALLAFTKHSETVINASQIGIIKNLMRFDDDCSYDMEEYEG